MSFESLLRLAIQTVTAPREVARLLLSIRPGAEALWTAFALVVILNALVFSVSQLISPSQMPAMFGSPALFAAMQGGVLGATIVALTFTGRLLGGQGRLQDVAVLLIWMQLLRVMAQAVLMLLIPLSPVLGAAFFMALTVVGIWILLNFLDEVHELGGIFKAVLVLGLGLLAMAFALSIILALAGVDPNGMTQNV